MRKMLEKKKRAGNNRIANAKEACAAYIGTPNYFCFWGAAQVAARQGTRPAGWAE
jgi:hypothetical protein